MATRAAPSPCPRWPGRPTLTAPTASAGRYRLQTETASSRQKRMRSARSVGVTPASVPAVPGASDAGSEGEVAVEAADVVGASGHLEDVTAIGRPHVAAPAVLEHVGPVGAVLGGVGVRSEEH